MSGFVYISLTLFGQIIVYFLTQLRIFNTFFFLLLPLLLYNISLFFPSFTYTIHNLYCSCNTNGWLLLNHACSAIVLWLQFSFIDISWYGTNFGNLQKIYKPHGFFLDPGDKLQINVSDFKTTKYVIYHQLSCMAIL